MRLFRHLWIKIGVPIVLLTLFAVIGLSVMGRPWLAVAMAALGVFTVVATRRSLRPLEDVTQVIEGIAGGDLDHRTIDEGRDDEIGRLARSTNEMVDQLNELSTTAEQLAQGKIDVVDVEGDVLQSGRLSDADTDPGEADGDLERSFIRLTNQMRRLTIQARIIARDDLYNPLLDERVPGELGEAFGLMVRNLRTIADRAKDIAEGDLTSYVEGEGDLTTAFNQMVTELNDLVQRIVETAIHISSASEEILVVLRDQELAASHQASGVEETQRTMETLLSSAKKIADNSQTVYKSAEKTQDNNRTVAERIGELKSHTARITEILEVIKSIADRSDLLALNASLEGMRAGEAGKGFTLVAEEMRRLAENIKDSIGDIKELVSDIRESSMATVMATEEGSRLSEQTTETALQISLITQQQKSGTEQVTQSMDELSQLINQGVAGTRQVTTAASDLAGAAEVLRDLVDEFEVEDAPDEQEIRDGDGAVSYDYDTSKLDASSYSTPDDHEPGASGVYSTLDGDDSGLGEFGGDDDGGGDSDFEERVSNLDFDSDFDPTATLNESKKFARRARESVSTPSFSGDGDDEVTDGDPSSDGDDTGVGFDDDADPEVLDTPTVKFSSDDADMGILEEFASSDAGEESDSGEALDRSGEFEAIARGIEDGELDTSEVTDGDDHDGPDAEKSDAEKSETP